MRPAAFKAARPKPCLIRQEHADAPFALAVKDQQRLAARALHDCFTVWRRHADQAEPAAPFGRAGFRPFEAACHGVALAKLCQFRAETFFAYGARRQGREGGGERRIGDRRLARIFGTGGDQQRAALFDILRNVIVVERRQHISMLVAVKDYEVEILDPFDK